MRDVLDLHTHTIASGHAYNTMMEMIHEAQNKGLDVYGITEHAPRMKGTCTDFYFHNLKVVPRKHGDLELLLGVELNILDEYGTVDLEEPHLGDMDVTIASLHKPCIQPGRKIHISILSDIRMMEDIRLTWKQSFRRQRNIIHCWSLTITH